MNPNDPVQGPVPQKQNPMGNMAAPMQPGAKPLGAMPLGAMPGAMTPTPVATPKEPEPDSQAEEEEGRIFDISSDLTISPLPAGALPPDVAPNVPKTAPANPPSKRFGGEYGFVPPKPAALPHNLQEAISSMIPEQLKPQPPVATATQATQAAQPAAPSGMPVSPSQSAMPASQTDVPKPRPFTTQLPTDPQMKPLRTYESDVADVLAHRRSSATSIAIAEQVKKGEGERIGNDAEASNENANTALEEPRVKTHTGLKTTMLLLSLILIGGGIIGGLYLYQKSPLSTPTAAPTPPVQAPQSVIPADSQAIIYVDGLGQAEIVARIDAEIAKPQAAGTVKEIVLAETQNGAGERAPITDMLNTLAIPAPDMIQRTLTAQWMLGVYAEPSGAKDVFVITETDFFQNAFAGMLQWEGTMADDLRQYLPVVVASTIQASATASSPITLGMASSSMASTTPARSASSTSSTPASAPMATTTSRTANPTMTATSTPTTTQSSTTSQAAPVVYQANPRYTVIQGSFQDRIVKNADVREFIDPNGQTLFLYSFINSSILVVTRDEAALTEVIDRLDAQAFVR